MKTVITCGHPYSGFENVFAHMQAAGLQPAQPSRREGMDVDALHTKILRSYDVAPEAPAPECSLELGKVWQELATDLFVGNMDSPQWGWADPRSAWLLDFWKDMDKQVRFVLVYSSPEYALAQMIHSGKYTAQDALLRLQGYHAYNAYLLHFYTRHPDRCVLLEQQTVPQQAAALFQHLQTQWGVVLHPPTLDNTPENAPPAHNVVAQFVAQQLLQNAPQLHAIYAELQSVATLSAHTSEQNQTAQDSTTLLTDYMALYSECTQAQQLDALQSAWLQEKAQFNQTCAQLQQDVATAQAQAKEAAIQLAQEKEKNKALAAQAKEAANKATQAAADSQHTELKQENELLLSQLHQVQEELEKLFLKNQELTKQLEQTAAQQPAQKKLQQDLAAAQAQAKDTAAKLAQEQAKSQTLVQQAKAAADRQRKEIEEENELLLSQLHQVQEELENYFLKHQKISHELKELTQQREAEKLQIPLAQHYWNRLHPAEVLIDLREAVRGSNWYAPELDGSWAGPAQTSTIQMPALRKGKYDILIDVVDAMDASIIQGLQASLAGQPLEFKKEIHDKSAVLRARVDAKQLPAVHEWTLQLDFPAVVSPAAHGSDDTRQLAVRVKTIKFKAVN